MNRQGWIRYLTIIILGIAFGGAAALLAWLQKWMPLRLPHWSYSALFWAGVLAVAARGFGLRRRHPGLGRLWIFCAAGLAVALAYLFPQALAPGCGGMPRALARWETRCYDVCVTECTWWVPLGDPLCPDHLLPVDTKWENVQYYCVRMHRAFS